MFFSAAHPAATSLKQLATAAPHLVIRMACVHQRFSQRLGLLQNARLAGAVLQHKGHGGVWHWQMLDTGDMAPPVQRRASKPKTWTFG